MKQIKSGMAQLLKVVASKFFENPHSLLDGVQLQLAPAVQIPFFGRLGLIIGDEVALKQCLSFKGAAGSLPCFICRNVCQHASDLHEHDQQGILVPHTSVDLHRMIFHSANSILESVEHLRSQKETLNKTAFQRLEQSLGITYQPEGALFDPSFHMRFRGGPTACCQYDWMHCYLVSGIFNSEVGLLMETLAGYPFSRQLCIK